MGMLDGLCLWAWEVLRPPAEQSPSVIKARAASGLAAGRPRGATLDPYFAPLLRTRDDQPRAALPVW